MHDLHIDAKLNNKGFTLLETMICFVLLGIIVVAASQIIQSNTKVYYETKSLSYGLQISQTTLTEIRGEIESAVTYTLLTPNEATGDPAYLDKYSGKYHLALTEGNGTSYSVIEFIGTDGKQRKLSLDTDDNVLVEEITPVYTRLFSRQITKQTTTNKLFDSAYIGMGYVIKDIKFSLIEKKTTGESLPVSNCPVIKIELTIYSEKWGEYSSTDYAPLYNFTENGEVYIYKQMEQ